MKNFNAKIASLEGTNLTEASAGTGKTYSIAVLVLRLLVEKGLRIEEILMVTFTKAAVAELEERIRLFVRAAYKHAQYDTKAEEIIQDIVKTASKKHGKESIIKKLRQATLYLDETAIFTIHSFCQKTLSEFAFETGQLYDCEMVNDQGSLLEEAVNEYWRRNITILPTPVLSTLIEYGLSKEMISKVVMNALSGKKFVFSPPANGDEEETKTRLQKEAEEAKKEILRYYQQNKSLIHEAVLKAGHHAKNLLEKHFNNPQDFIDTFIAKHNEKDEPPKYISKQFRELCEFTEKINEKEEIYATYIKALINQKYEEAIQEITLKIEQLKHKNSLLSFDDLIVNLHKAVTSNDSSRLHKAMEMRYKAVFIDEFQDTDKLQYEIFDSLFHDKSILFYIGDPKQSIYGWRKADINTYKHARKKVGSVYTMNNNFRSTESLIAAMNSFFYPEEGFNTFSDDIIEYIPVKKGREQLAFSHNNESPSSISIFETKNNNETCTTACAEILSLLCEDFRIGEQRVKASDIAVLVRNNKQAKRIKAELTTLGIPAITVDDTMIMNTAEATEVFYILLAVVEPSLATINRALFCSFTGLSINDITRINEEEELKNFRKLREVWEEDGVYSMMMHFISIYRIKNILLDKSTENGERIITNIYQVSELLHKKEIEKRYSQDELISWFRRIREEDKKEGDEYEQRVESDEDAVTITTIHKSKGLSYNIVVAPYLDLDSKFSHLYETIDFRSKEHEYCFSTEKSDEQKELYIVQNEQENRRLIYVAITRAVYKCYLSSSSYFKNSSLKPFIHSLKQHPVKDIEFLTSQSANPSLKYKSSEDKINRTALPIDAIKRMNTRWRVNSFSSLSGKHTTSGDYSKGEDLKHYDNFIFNMLTKGAVTGNFIHRIFECIDFNDNKDWMQNIVGAGRRYSSVYNEKHKDFYGEMINNVLGAEIKTNDDCFSLSQITKSQKYPELEFFFSLNKLSTAAIKRLPFAISTENDFSIEGMMHGFVDLFFEHNNRYYILDWKSNYLGGTISSYDREHLKEAMSINNYHLQYLIYTVAVKRLLESKIPNFSYERDFGGIIYVFVRGTRQGNNEGIYYVKPELGVIEELEGMMLG